MQLGPPSGYVIAFTNGLKVYLSGDTGLHSEMKTLVNEYHKANLAVMNLGTSAVTMTAAAYAINNLVAPAAVIASHTNEASTSGGKLRPESRAAAFAGFVKGRPVYPALSGRTMEFDGNAKCVAGC
jgi:L-ascorbate metabolism protein UlaG (beta-lactamase superfamily)